MKIGRIVLVLAVVASSLAWIPSTTQAASEAETSAAPKVEAWIVGARLYVEANRLPRNHVFNLRARRGSASSWTRLGSGRSTRWGEMNKSVRLPSYLMRGFRLQVCLKDRSTDQLYCTRARRVY
jgi:hypothetical protein